MKKCLSLVLALVMALGLLTVGGPAARAYNEGDIPGTTGTGTKSDPVIVDSFEELKTALQTSERRPAVKTVSMTRTRSTSQTERPQALS